MTCCCIPLLPEQYLLKVGLCPLPAFSFSAFFYPPEYKSMTGEGKDKLKTKNKAQSKTEGEAYV
ncbi:hypothetical protein HG1285_11073 [Hydrogenivirga sp. 128-5-R1-1]|nr:hypothetical protein HG1285_11073 [Hydrogenivirga sp. 128-5-R1-1]